MSNNPDPEQAVPAEAIITTITNVSGGVNLDAKRDVTIGGDVVGRDKIVATYGYTVEQVSTLLTQISNTFQPKPFDGRCPYLGLDAFSEDDADRFFGRETLVCELVARAKESRFVVIAGPSGSGKSSLVRAGLIHALKQGALPNSDRWLYATLTPSRDPIESLALAMSRLAKSPDAGKYVREHFEEPGALHEFAESQLSDRQDQRAVIFVDQFEEVFTQVSKEDERLAFLNLLTHAATLENGRVTVLFALRSDFVSNCATYPQLNALLNQQFMQVGAMQPNELVSAIARPALQAGLRIDPDLVTQIVNDMQDEPGVLPLMQFALKDLFDSQQTKGGMIALTLNDYLTRGGLRKALECHADTAFAQLNEDEQLLARTIFSGLIEIGRGTQNTRRTATFDELVPANGGATQVQMVIHKLADARLIATDERDHQVIVTIAHEKLIDAWPWLRRLVNENFDAIALQNQIAEDAQEWDRNHKDLSYLYVGARLATAREQLAAQKIVLSGLAQQFVEEGVATEAADREREEIRRQKELDDAHKLTEETEARLKVEEARAKDAERAAQRLKTRNRVITVAGGVALMAAIVAIIFGVRAEQQTRIAFYRQLAAQTTARLPDHFDLALLLSLETTRIGDTLGDSYESRDSLLKSLQINPHLAGFLFGHSGEVTSVAFSSDHKLLASGSGDGSIILWDVATRQRLGAPLTGHSMWVNSVTFSPDGKMLASGSFDRSIILWDVATHQRLGSPLTGHSSQVNNVAFSPDGKTLTSGSGDGGIIFWDVATHQRLGVPLTGHSDGVNSVTFSSDGKTLASGGWDGNIILWDVATHQRLGEPLTGHSRGVTSVAFSPDGRMLASGSSDNCILLWDVATHQRQGGPLTSHSDVVTSVAFSPDGKTLASGSGDNRIILWDVATHQRLGDPFTGHSGAVVSVAFSSDGKTLASGSFDRSVILWDMATRQRLGEPLSGHSDGVNSVAFSPDGKTLASGSWDRSIFLWDVATHQRLDEILTGLSDGVKSVAFGLGGKMLASGSSDGSIIMWDVATRQRLGGPLRGHSSQVNSVAFSPDGKTLASGGWDRSIILWDVATHQRLAGSFTGLSDGVNSVVFSPDGRILVSGNSDGSIILWGVAIRQRLGDPLTGHSGAVNSVAFSLDGKTLASGSSDGNIILWDVATRQRLGEPLTGHSGAVAGVALSPDGKTLASGSSDNRVILWDVTTRQRLGEAFTGHSSAVTSVAFSLDGKTLASGSLDRSIILWDVDRESWKASICQIAGRNFTQSEWKQYLGALEDPYHKMCEQWPAGE